MAPPSNSLSFGGCESSPGGVLGLANAPASAAPCVLAVLDSRSPSQERLLDRGHYVFFALFGAAWNFDGHFVTSESFSPTNVPPRIVPLTMISRPPRNGSGTSPV